MSQVTDGDTFVEISGPMPWGRRLLFFFLAFFPWLAPYELLLRPGWTSFFNFMFLLSLVISLGAIFLSGFLFFIAFAGLAKLLRFDAKSKEFTYIHDAPIVPFRRDVIHFREIEDVVVHRREWSDGPASFSVRVMLKDGHHYESSSFADEQGASRALKQVEDILHSVS